MAYHQLRIVRIIQETADARSFVLALPPALAAGFRYRAGQFLTFRVPLEQGDIARCYSLCSAPEAGGDLQIAVKRVVGGRGSNWFHDVLKAGDTLDVMPPAGRFVLDPAPAASAVAPLLFFAGGSGITPVLSLIKSGLATTSRRMRLLYANRDDSSVIFRAELDALARAHPDRLEIVHHLDAAAGYLTADAVTAVLAGYTAGDAYLCGPGPFMTLVESALLAGGLPRERVHIERFEAAGNSEVPVAAPAGETIPSEILIHLDGKAHHVPYAKGQTILAAARAAGLQPSSACEEGFCASCAAKTIKGRIELANNEIYTAEELAKGWILTCQGHAFGDEVEITYDTI